MSRGTIVQVLALALLAGGLAFLVIASADSWADWVVLGAICLTALGAALAVHHRGHPDGKRSFSRSSDSRR